MKFSIFLLIISIVLSVNFAKAQSNSFDKNAISMLHKFYKTYIAVAANDHNNPKIDFLKPIRESYCTRRLNDEINNNRDDDHWGGSDPFTKAQYADIQWLKILTVNKYSSVNNSYAIEYTDLGTYEHITIYATVVNINGKYLIDKVW
jgi:acyl-ACP thioesterase